MNISKEHSGLGGILSPLAIFLFTIVSIFLNPWFNFSEFAFSHLGGSEVSYNYIFNLGLIISGLLGTIFSFGLFNSGKKVYSKIGSISFGIGMISFSLLGVFPFGTTPHVYLAGLFYVFSILGRIPISLSDISHDKYLAPLIFITVIICLSLTLYLMMNQNQRFGLAIIETIGFIPIFEFQISYGSKLIYS
ncbi:hypothetical protein C9439_02790 [archaeon SCG-AAA382B04]|nr:hypothetical protein C9439_02790 [archaeon SCG-AAA382B04]